MSGKKKIVLIGSAHPLRGGLATFNERLIREFRDRGDDACIYNFQLQYPSFFFPGKTQFTSEAAPADLPIYIKVNSINPLNWYKVGKELQRLNPDIVIVKFWVPFMAPCFGTICRIIKKNRHSKIVSIVDNLIPHEKRPGDKLLIKYWVACVDGFIVMSHSVEKDIRKFLTPPHTLTPTLFCPHPLYDNFGLPVLKSDALQKLNLDPSYHYILFFGFIRDYKGLDLLLRAFADKRFQDKPLKLIIAGEFYCDPKPYLEIIEKNNLTDRVIMSNDFIPDSQVVNYFCAADLVVQPYKNATQSGVTQIAYHFNKPMIITDVGGLSEIVPDNRVGYVVKPEVLELKEAILKFFNENKEEEFSKNAGIEKSKYSWNSMVQSVDKLVEL